MLHVVVIRWVAVFLKMTLYTVTIRDVVSVLVALAAEHLPISGGVGSARNLGDGGGVDGVGVSGVVAVGVGVAVDGDGCGAGNVGDVGIVERSGALNGRGECAAFSGDGGVGGEQSGDRVGQERGERCSSPSSSSLFSNSTSHLRFAAFLVRLAGGETVFVILAVPARCG
jgi:hypothetical protein